MIANFVNRYDFVDFGKIARRHYRRLLKSAWRSDERVRQAWDKRVIATELNMAPILRRENQLVSGAEDVDRYDYTAEKYLQADAPLRALSFGCGSGEHDIQWAKRGVFSALDGYDLSPSRIEIATSQAEAAGLSDVLTFECRNVFDVEVDKEPYDVIIFESSLHHFAPLERIVGLIRRLVKKGGHILLYDFVGPTKWQWLPRQLEVVNGLLAMLQEKYRRLPDGDIFRRRFRPSLLRMHIMDPSEAIESSGILPTLQNNFVELELKNAGGAILYHLFPKIIQNFDINDPEAQRWLQACIAAEDACMVGGDDVGWWYAYGVYQV